MARVRFVFDTLSLFEDEEAGDTHLAVYASLTAANGAELAAFRWNNLGTKVDEVATYNLGVDPGIPNVVDVELAGAATLTVSGFTDDDNAWPDEGSHENALGSASVVVDSRVPSTLGDLLIGPTQTDNNNTGFDVAVQARIIEEPVRAQLRLTFEKLLLLEDEEAGDTHLAVYVRALAPAQGGVDAIDRELLRWNNAGAKVDEINSYPMSAGGVVTTVDLTVGGPTQVWVAGFTDDDNAWPDAGSHENALGQATLVIDPADPDTLGTRRLGPTTTDNGNQGLFITMTSEVLPPDATPDLEITGVEVTQAIQHFGSALGPDNSLPLIAGKTTLVRVYLDSGIDPSEGGGTVSGVTGTLTLNHGAFSIGPTAPITAKPIAQVDRNQITDTLNFQIPREQANGKVTMLVQATVGGSVSNPEELTLDFSPSPQLDILMVRIRSGSMDPPTRSDYFAAINQLSLIYPIADTVTHPIRFWIVPGSEEFTNTHDLTNVDGMHDLLDDLEDIQEESADFKKLYALVPTSVPMARTGTSRPSDNVALGHDLIMESVGHELGHVYGLDHAPCGGPDDVDDDFVPPDGSIGDVGVDPVALVTFPASTKDFMSYCGDRGASKYENLWVSGYHWAKLHRTLADI
jgi:hypothetical protein